MRVHPMLEREPLCAEERARQAARPEVLPLKFGHLRGEPLGRDEPLDLRGNQIPRAPRHRRDVVIAWPKVRNEEDRQKIIRVLLEAQGELFSLRNQYCQKGEEEKE